MSVFPESIPAAASAISVPCTLTKDEQEALKTVALDLGHKNVSHFIRSCIMEKAGPQIGAIVQSNLQRREGLLSSLKAG